MAGVVDRKPKNRLIFLSFWDRSFDQSLMRCLGFTLAGVIASLGCNAPTALDHPEAGSGSDAAAPPPSASADDASLRVAPDATPPPPSSDADAAPMQVPDASRVSSMRVPYRATAIALGEEHACALLDDGHVKCWGDNDYGQLGLGDTVRRNDASTLGDALPTIDLGTGRRAVAIAAGQYTSCAWLDDGSFKCWGYAGLAGSAVPHGDTPGSMGDALPSLNFGPGRKLRQVAIGLIRTFGLLDDGSVTEWSSDPPVEVRPASATPAIVALTPADGSVAALFADGSLDLLDPVAAGGPLVEQRIVRLAAGAPVRAIGGNDVTMCVILVAGGIRCDSDGPPVTFGASTSFASVATTDNSSWLACGLPENGDVICNGATSSWWVAMPSASDPSPLVALGQPAKAIAGGAVDLCALLADGTVMCWSAIVPSSAYGLPGIAYSAPAERHAGPWLPVDLGTHLAQAGDGP